MRALTNAGCKETYGQIDNPIAFGYIHPMKIIIPLFILIFSVSAFAKNYPVLVQCSPIGPQYQGSLDAELELDKWVPVSDCSSYGDWYMQTLRVPVFTLKFNGLTYKNDRTDVKW